MITDTEILNAQEKWGDGIVNIGKLKGVPEEAMSYTKDFLEESYDFKSGIQFKPTKASEKQFRNNIESALSYFIGGNENYSEDTGFAFKPWVSVEFKNDTVKIYENIAIAMGNYLFKDTSGSTTKVEYSFAYIKSRGVVKIILHHSSLPYSI